MLAGDVYVKLYVELHVTQKAHVKRLRCANNPQPSMILKIIEAFATEHLVFLCYLPGAIDF